MLMFTRVLALVKRSANELFCRSMSALRLVLSSADTLPVYVLRAVATTGGD